MGQILSACREIVSSDVARIAFELAGVAAFAACALWLPRLSDPRLARAGALAARYLWTPLALFVIGAVTLFALYPYLWDHGDVAVAAIAAAYRHGEPVYSGLDGKWGFYSLAYGPLLYEVQAAATALSATILASKLPGLLSFAYAVVAIVAVLRRHAPASFAGAFAALSGLALLPSLLYSFAVRAESLLLAVSAGAMLGQVSLARVTAACVIGACAGAAAALKLTACLYFAPAAFWLLFASPDWPARLRLLALFGASALATFAPTLLLPNLNVAAYAEQLSLSSGVGYSAATFVDNLLQGAIILAPPFVILPARGRPMTGAERAGLIALLCAALAVSVIGSKFGSWSYVLLPFIPVSAGFSVLLAQGIETDRIERTARSIALGACALAVAYLPFAGSRASDLLARAKAFDTAAAAVREARVLYAKYPDAQMGAGGGEDYVHTATRMIGPLRGGELIFDVAAWMEFAFVAPERAAPMSLSLLEDCRVRTWILPRKAPPFSMDNYYGGVFFTDAFRARFLVAYRLGESTAHYDVWTCQHP